MLKWHGIRLKRLAEEQGRSLSEIAETINVTKQALNYWIHKKTVPTGINLVLLCRTLNVAVDYFFSEEKETENKAEEKAIVGFDSEKLSFIYKEKK